MSVDTLTALPFSNAIPADIMADLESISAAAAAGEKADPDVVRRVRELAENSREAIFRRNGLLDIAVPTIRELRDA